MEALIMRRMDAGPRKGARRLAAASLFAAALSLASCGNPGEGERARDAGSQAASSPSSSEPAGADPRAAFESSGMLSGLNVDIQEIRLLSGSRGSPRAGVALGYGSSLGNAVFAIGESGSAAKPGALPTERLVSASGAASLPLPGPVIALAVSGESIVASCALAEGSSMLMGFRPGDASGILAESWKRADKSRGILIPIPGGRIAAGGDDGFVSVFDAADGREIWRSALSSPNPPVDMAYAPGYVLACVPGSLQAFEEGSGKKAWSAAFGSDAASLSAGSGVAAVLTPEGRLYAFILADGSRLVESSGPFDPAVRPVIDSSRIFAAVQGGGAREIELKSGNPIRSWAWRGQSSFLATDASSIYAGVSGMSGPRIVVAARSGSGEARELPLAAASFDAPAAVHGSRGGLLMLLRDGSICLATADQPRAQGESPLDRAASAPQPAASAILTALGRFRARNPSDSASSYLRFDLFVSGMPVDPAVAFTAFRYEAQASGVARFAAEPAAHGIVIAVYDDDGGEIEANIDELGAKMSVDVRVQKGKTYWIAAGRAAGAEEAAFRLYSR